MYGTYHTRICIWYDHTCMVQVIASYVHGAYETPLVFIKAGENRDSSRDSGELEMTIALACS